MENPSEPEKIHKMQSHIPKHIVILSVVTVYGKLLGDLQPTIFIKTTVGLSKEKLRFLFITPCQNSGKPGKKN